MQFDKRFPLKLSAALLCLATVLYGAPARAEGSDGYLIDSAGSPVRAFSGECWHTRSSAGVGESEPVASCPGLRGRRLIACLQPDRSAQLTAVGSELRVSDASL